MEQVPELELMIRLGYFKHIKENERAKCQRKLKWEPAPKREVGCQPNINCQYPGYPECGNSQCCSQKTVCRSICPPGEPQKQEKSEAYKQHSKERSVTKGDMECVVFQVG